jgi:hypothetical protein
VTRLLDGRHHLERFAMEQAGEVDYLITWRDNEFVGRVSLTPCRRAGANRRCFAFPKILDNLATYCTRINQLSNDSGH